MEQFNQTFTVNVVGTDSGNPYTGEFSVKTLLTRQDQAVADQVRRGFIGADPANASPRSQADGFMIGQLAVRITKAPDWWTNSNNGRDLPDANVLEDVFEKALAEEEKRKAALIKDAEKVQSNLKKK